MVLRTERPAPGVVQSIGHSTFRGLGSLIRLLPTGTVFLFHFLSPILTNNGHCSVANRVLAGALLVFCTFSCCFASFTDSYMGADGRAYYGIVTSTGIRSFYNASPPREDAAGGRYRLRCGDFVHAFYSVVVFAVIGLLDSNTLSCFYPEFESKQKVLLMVLPPVVGGMSSVISAAFPNTRHGIGYPPPTSTTVDS